MEESSQSMRQTDRSNFEARFALWQESYQKYEKMLAEFRQRQRGFDYQMALHEYRRCDFQAARDDLRRVKNERVRKQATRL